MSHCKPCLVSPLYEQTAPEGVLLRTAPSSAASVALTILAPGQLLERLDTVQYADQAGGNEFFFFVRVSADGPVGYASAGRVLGGGITDYFLARTVLARATQCALTDARRCARRADAPFPLVQVFGAYDDAQSQFVPINLLAQPSSAGVFVHRINPGDVVERLDEVFYVDEAGGPLTYIRVRVATAPTLLVGFVQAAAVQPGISAPQPTFVRTRLAQQLQCTLERCKRANRQ